MLDTWVNTGMKRAGIGQAELARKLTESLGRSIDRAAVNKMVKGGRDLAADEMLAISKITGEPLPGLASVPVLPWSSASGLADPGARIPVEDVPLLVFADLGDGEFFALKVEGDSMDRYSPAGSIIVIDRSSRAFLPGRSFLFAVRGEVLYRNWHPDPPYLAPHSTNPTHQPLFIRRQKDLEVIGRVRRSVLDL